MHASEKMYCLQSDTHEAAGTKATELSQLKVISFVLVLLWFAHTREHYSYID